MRSPKLLAMVMAGGEGKRLYPLTVEQSKPAVPFGGRYRIVDFVLSNMINSEIHAIYLLVQYHSQSLIEHVRKAWIMSPITPQYFITVVPPQMRRGMEWFQGTADAVHQNLNLIYEHHPDYVAVFGADHVYRMDIRQMLAFHQECSADVTISTVPVPIGACNSFGILRVNTDNRVIEFHEKPNRPLPIPSDPSRCFASMGNYLFKTDVLIDALEKAHRQNLNDFGRDVLPRLLASHRVLAYNFAANEVPGVKAYEEQMYWRDVGNIDTYFEANRDILGLEPRFDVYNPDWPIYSSNYLGPDTRVLAGDIVNTVIGGGSVVNHARIRNTVLRREVTVEEDVEIEDCIVMDHVTIGRGSRLRRTIVDGHNVLPPGTKVGFDQARDKQRYFVTDSGLVVVPQGARHKEWGYDAD